MKIYQIINFRSLVRKILSKRRTKNVMLGGFSFAVTRILCSILGFFQIGIVVRYLSPQNFGLWASVASFSSIFSVFNFGFGSSLLNKLSKLYAQENNEESKVYFFSVVYALFILIFIIIFFVFLIKPLIPWNILFKTENLETIKTGSLLFIIFSVLTLISIPISLNDIVFYSYQEAWWVSVFALLLSSLLLISSILLVRFHSSFVVLVVSMSIMPLISSTISLFTMLWKRKWNIILVNFRVIVEKVKELSVQSLQFLFIQVPTLFLLSLDTLVISKTAGLENAGEYFLVKKLAFFFAIIYMSLYASVWACYSEAVEKGDFKWVKKMLNVSGKLTIFAYLFFISLFCLFGNSFVHLWAGKYVENSILFLLLGVWSFLYSWGSCFSIFLNSIGHLKLQAILLTIGAIILFPLSIFLGNKLGIIGVCLAWIIVSSITAISNPIQSYIFIKKQGASEIKD